MLFNFYFGFYLLFIIFCIFLQQKAKRQKIRSNHVCACGQNINECGTVGMIPIPVYYVPFVLLLVW